MLALLAFLLALLAVLAHIACGGDGGPCGAIGSGARCLFIRSKRGRSPQATNLPVGMTDTKASVVRALQLGTLDAKPAGPSSLMWDAEV